MKLALFPPASRPPDHGSVHTVHDEKLYGKPCYRLLRLRVRSVLAVLIVSVPPKCEAWHDSKLHTDQCEFSENGM
jgi:hypothetical protein